MLAGADVAAGDGLSPERPTRWRPALEPPPARGTVCGVSSTPPGDGSCLGCRAAPRETGLLCGRCAAALRPPTPLLPRHIEPGPAAPPDAEAWLVDPWGRAHALGAGTLGREGDLLRVHSGLISRVHAAIERDGARWQLRDLQSRNGTAIDDTPLARGTLAPLSDRALVRLADVGFRFVVGALEASAREPAIVRTQTLAAPIARSGGLTALSLHENPMGGGGVLELGDGRTFDLPLMQLELLQLLLAEWLAHPELSPEVRGFVTSAYLMAALSWDTPNPGPDHLKQLIRRTRQQIEGSGVGIEGRRGAGYRLGPESAA